MSTARAQRAEVGGDGCDRAPMASAAPPLNDNGSLWRSEQSRSAHADEGGRLVELVPAATGARRAPQRHRRCERRRPNVPSRAVVISWSSPRPRAGDTAGRGPTTGPTVRFAGREPTRKEDQGKPGNHLDDGLLGQRDESCGRSKARFPASIHVRGNEIAIDGEMVEADRARAASSRSLASCCKVIGSLESASPARST